ncbi:MAG TPA: VTT domain-containing protein [Candidatus Acidoferrales bacterium]|nr:VTT domain-containing protein [Candidatus Acidoferrales bacterium]
MRFASGIFALLLRSGGVGLLVLGVLDSSYLFAPWGNDLLLVALTSRHPSTPYMLYLAVMSTAGSVLGCLLLDVTVRPLGEKGLERYLSRRRLNRVREKVGRNAGRALAVAAIVPPPFPFTAFVMAASALQYPRTRLLSVIAATRLLRFILLGTLALHFGYRILAWTRSPAVVGVLISLIVVCVVGSIISAYTWIKHSRGTAGQGHSTRGRR